MPHLPERIRFRKRQIKNLQSFPSAQSDEGGAVDSKPYQRRRFHKARKALSWFFIGLFVLLVFIVVLLKVGISGSLLTNQMQAILSKHLDGIANATIRDARLSLDSNFHIALEATEVHLSDIKNGVAIDDIGAVKLGLSTFALLRGAIDVEQFELHDTRIILPRSDNGNFWDSIPKDDNGHIDADRLRDMLFAQLDGFLGLFDRQHVHRVVVKNVALDFLTNANEPQILVADHLVFQNEMAALDLKASLNYHKKAIELKGQITRDENKNAKAFTLSADNFAVHFGAAEGESAFFADGRTNNMFLRITGTGAFNMSGQRDDADRQGFLRGSFNLEDGMSEIGTEGNMPTQIALTVEHQAKSGKIEILPSQMIVGGLKLPLNGAFGVMPDDPASKEKKANYRFEVISNDAVSAPTESPETPLPFAMKLGGIFDIAEKKISFSDMLVKTPVGQLTGGGSIRFGEGSPEMIFILHAGHLSVQDVKQLWPANISPGGRRWVLSHIFGGDVPEGTIEIAMPQGHFGKAGAKPITGKEVRINAVIQNTRSDTIGELPAIRDATGTVEVEGMKTTVKLATGTAYLENNNQIAIHDGVVVIPWGLQRPIYAEMELNLQADAKTAGDVLKLKPIAAADKLPFKPEDAKGDISTLVKIRFPVTRDNPPGEIHWQADVKFRNFSLAEPFNTIKVMNGEGSVQLNRQGMHLLGNALLNDLPAALDIIQPFEQSSSAIKQEKITLNLNDDLRSKFVPFLNTFLTGPIAVEVGNNINGKRHLIADLTNANLEFPWVGWRKGKGIAAKAEFDLPGDFSQLGSYTIDNFNLSGANLNVSGSIIVEGKQLKTAHFPSANLNRDDNIALDIKRDGRTYNITATGNQYDARALIKSLGKSSGGASNDAVNFRGTIAKITGFHNEILNHVTVTFEGSGKTSNLIVTGASAHGQPFSVNLNNQTNSQSVSADSADAGALLSFMDYYDKVQGGSLMARLSKRPGQDALSGPVTLRHFVVVDEPKIATLVNNSANANKGKNNGKVDATRVNFDVAFANLGKGDNYLVLDQGILRGPSMGLSFQGVLYDSSGNMAITGTFMPAYGLNRLFGDVPILGQVLGNGRDGGLFGITFKVEGDTKSPRIKINPISAIAPGIFRSIFEFQ